MHLNSTISKIGQSDEAIRTFENRPMVRVEVKARVGAGVRLVGLGLG